jgi:hypothetical protein
MDTKQILTWPMRFRAGIPRRGCVLPTIEVARSQIMEFGGRKRNHPRAPHSIPCLLLLKMQKGSTPLVRSFNYALTLFPPVALVIRVLKLLSTSTLVFCTQDRGHCRSSITSNEPSFCSPVKLSINCKYSTRTCWANSFSTSVVGRIHTN